jgi:hypothetical protein
VALLATKPPETFIDPARKQNTPAWHTGEGTKEESKLTMNQREKQTDDGPRERQTDDDEHKQPSGTIPLKGCRVGRETDLYLDSPTGAGDMSREKKPTAQLLPTSRGAAGG